MASVELEERTATYSVERRDDGNYRGTTFTCPTTGRRYLSVQTPIPYRTAVAASCYWCDSYGRRREQDGGFDPNAPQCHMYPLTEPPPGSYGGSLDRKKAVAHQLAELLAAARRDWAAKRAAA